MGLLPSLWVDNEGLVTVSSHDVKMSPHGSTWPLSVARSLRW